MTKQEDNTVKYMLGIQIVLILILILQAKGISSALSEGIPAVGGSGTGGAQPSAPSPSQPSAPQAGISDMKALADDDPFKGDADAPVTIIEWSDFQCPFCGRFFQETLPSIQSQYIDTGKVKFVYRDFPLDSIHPQATPVAIAANCAGNQGKFWEYHDLIFQNQASIGEASYTRWADDLGLDMAEWNACRQDPATRQEIQKDLNDGSAAGVRGTPGFVINGQLVSGAQPFSAFQQVIEAELSR